MKNWIEKNKKYLIIATAAILLIAVVVVLLLTLTDRKEPNGDADDTPEATEQQTTVREDPMETEEPDNHGQIIDYNNIPDISERSNGIDVSKWQGVINWKEVKESGIEFAFVRVGYRGENGIIYKDEYADYNMQQAHSNGILTGVYFFSTALSIEEAEEEAEWVLDYVKGYNVSYPIVYDCEGYRDSTSRMYYLNAEQRTNIALAFLSKISEAGYDAMHYGARNEMMIPFYWDIERIAQKYKIWVAIYPEITYPEIDFPEYYGRADAWQYTDKGIVNGIDGNVDLVVCYFREELKPPKNSDVVNEVAPEPLTDGYDVYKRVNEQVTAKSLTNLREKPSTQSNLVGSISNGEFVTRIGIGNKGWSMLEYEGRTVYAVTSYLTTDTTPQDTPDVVLDNTFTGKSDRVTAKISVNLRTLPSTVEGEVVGTLEKGTFLERVAISEKGWSRLIYNGQHVYAVSNYLTTQLIIETDPSEDVTFDFDAVDETVTAKIETNLRTYPSTEESEIVYTLPHGEFVKRIGINKMTGWSKLEYNGETVYAMTLYLTTEQNLE